MMENSSGLVYQVDTQGGKISTTQVVDKAIALKQEAEKAKKTLRCFLGSIRS